MRYVVVKDTPHKEFGKFHLCRADAIKEAERLCRLESASFIILEVIGTISLANAKPPVMWVEEQDEISSMSSMRR